MLNKRSETTGWIHFQGMKKKQSAKKWNGENIARSLPKMKNTIRAKETVEHIFICSEVAKNMQN